MSCTSIGELTNGPVLPWVSGLPPEVWACVGELIKGRKTLHLLVGVCRGFRDIFTPFLYARRVLELNLCSPLDWIQKPLPPGLAHSRALECLIFEFGGRHSKFKYEPSLNKGYAEFITKLLKAMSNLRSFRWLDGSFENNYNPPLMLRDPDLLSALKNSRKLRNLSIQFSSMYLEDRRAALNCSIPLKGFRNLISLELYELYGDETRLQNDIAGVLSACPNLKMLGLGLACDYDCEVMPEVVILEGECEFLEGLCIQYAARSNTKPLGLETLRLGHGCCVYKSSSAAVGNFLAKMIRIEGLKKLHLFNGLIKYDTEEDEEWSMEIEWSLLQDCKSLHQLSVSRLEPDVREWLNNGGKSVQELIITDHYGMYDDGLDEFNALTLPRLSMLFTREMTVSKRVRGYSESDIDSSVGFSDSDSHSNSWLEMESDGVEDEDLMDSALSGSQPSKVDKSVMTVLDRLYDSGSQLTRLGLCLDLETQWVQFSSHLPNLQHLTQLRLNGKSWRTGQYPSKGSSLWPDVHKAKDIALRYAQLIHSMCPSLKYIRIQWWAWNIQPARSSSLDGEQQAETVFHELDHDETWAIELFAIHTFVSQSGLPGPEEPRDGLSDEEQLQLDRLAAEIEERGNAGTLLEELSE